jgi:ferredoxin
MHLRYLKPLRVGVAVAFLALTASLFLDFRDVGATHMADTVLYLQFVPSLLNFLEAATLGTAGFLAVLLLTLLFGRVYCSTICPFGTLQDATSRLAGKKRRRYSFTKPHSALRYGILTLTVLLFLAGSGLLLNLLDPFSNFGRILSNLVRPVVLAANNLAAPVAEWFGSHAIYRVQWPAIVPASIGVALAMLITAGWLSARHGRLYCNTLCPVGALLGLISRLSLLRIRVDNGACIECGRCERVCKAGCIDFKAGEVDVSRCVGCYNCLAACRDNALHLMPRSQSTTRSDGENPGRRKFLIGLAVGGLGMTTTEAQAALPPNFVQSRPTTIPEKRTSPVSPPGSRSIEHFTSRCTACHLCVSACPSRVLAPSFLDYGVSGMMQPQMDFHAAHCNFDCTVCSNICPSGAILPLTKDQKRQTQMGVAHFVKENCVVYTDNTNCGACSEHCPTKAVHMVPYLNANGRKLVIPEVNEKICVGCGGCEHACPTRPYKAIWVDGNPVHKVAEKPIIEELKQPEPTEDFPF